MQNSEALSLQNVCGKKEEMLKPGHCVCYTSVLHKCATQECYTNVLHKCATQERYTSAVHKCGTQVRYTGRIRSSPFLFGFITVMQDLTIT